MRATERGFTLVEVLIAMSVFIAVLLIATDSFNLILTQASKLTRSEESNIEGMVGLEIFRHDLAQAGFGLFYEYDPGAADPQFPEAAAAPASTLNTGVTGVPRPVAAMNDIGATADGSYSTLAASDYLAIRATTASTNKNAQRWTFVQYSSSGKAPKRWASGADNIEDDTWVILVRRAFTSSGYRNRLVRDISVAVTAPEHYAVQFDTAAPFASAFRPQNPDEFLYVYALGDDKPRMPFNRTDYFVATGSVPTSCAENTGVLYKAVVNHLVGGGKDGSLSYIPILDCVANMQVVFGWDLFNGAAAGQDGLIDTYSNADGSAVSGSASIAQVQTALGNATDMRNSLKLVKVYLLAQVGRSDRTYTAPSPIAVGEAGELSLTKNFALSGNMLNHRWKLYKLVVRPKNIVAEQ